MPESREPEPQPQGPECEDYHCRCERFEVWERDLELIAAGVVAEGYCSACSCHEEDHGAGFRAAEQASADQGREAIEALFRGALGQN